jgi:predicted nucleotidyltransferase
MAIERDKHIISTIIPILKHHGIQKAGIFGSAVRGDAQYNDVDLLVTVDRSMSLLTFIALKHELEDALGCQVDLVEYDAIKPALRERILAEEVAVI